MRLRDCTPYVSCSQGNRHRFIFKLEEIIWWLAGNNVKFTSQVALMVWWRNNRRSLKKIYDTGIGIGSPSGRNQWVIWKKKNIHDRFGPARVKNGKHMISKMVLIIWFENWYHGEQRELRSLHSDWSKSATCYFPPFSLVGCPVEESLLLSTGLLFSRSTLDLLERGCSENVLEIIFFYRFSPMLPEEISKSFEKFWREKTICLFFFFFVSDPIIVNNK